MAKVEITENIITQAFNKWSDKWWFQTLMVIVVLYVLASPIVTVLVNNVFQKENITNTLDERDDNKVNDHQIAFEQSIQSYALAKKTMNNYLSDIDCEYMFLIEYHNGNENIITGIQFCRFDVTLEVGTGDLSYVPLEKWHDDIVARYDILLSEDLSRNKMMFYTKDQFRDVDKYLNLQLEAVDAQSFALINLKNKDDRVFGSLLCVSTNEHINLIAVHDCADELESILSSNKKYSKN